MKYGEIIDAAKALRSYYGLEGSGREDGDVSEWLNTVRPRCLIVLLVDAMGTSILQRHLKGNDFLLRNMHKSISTVFPPTTSAAVTAFNTGRYPSETAWLGWNQYFPEMKDNIILFRGLSMYGEQDYHNYPNRRLPVAYQYETMAEKGFRTASVWPRWGASHPSETFEDMAEEILKLTADPEMQYIYAYWDEFDSLMHLTGPSHETVKAELYHIQNVIEDLTERLPQDCALLVTADHSQIDTEILPLDGDPEICRMLETDPAIEARTMSFRVRPEYMDAFPDYFKEKYGKYYHIYSRQEVIEKKMFGEGKPHPDFEQFIGDYLAAAYTPVTFGWKGRGSKGDHAGMMEEEAYVPLIMIPVLNHRKD